MHGASMEEGPASGQVPSDETVAKRSGNRFIGWDVTRPNMSGSLPWSPAPPAPPTSDPSATLQNIERNTMNLLHWTRILVAVVIVLIIVTVFVG